MNRCGSRPLSLRDRPGWLRLFSVPMPEKAANLWPAPNLILQKLPAPEFAATAGLDCGGLSAGAKAGLIMMGTDYSYLAIEKAGAGCALTRATCKNANGGGSEIEEGRASVEGGVVWLRVRVSPGAVCGFYHSTDGEKFIPLGEPFTARPGRWIGAKVGLFCLQRDASQPRSHADIDWFRIQ